MIILSNMPMIIFVIVLIIILYLSFVLSVVIFVEKSRFNKRIEVNDYIEEQDYSKFEGLLRKDFSFYSNNNKLNGYIFNYENINNNKKIIFVNAIKFVPCFTFNLYKFISFPSLSIIATPPIRFIASEIAALLKLPALFMLKPKIFFVL